jgi:hypothetical protein
VDSKESDNVKAGIFLDLYLLPLNFYVVALHKNNEVEEEMGRACSTNGR